MNIDLKQTKLEDKNEFNNLLIRLSSSKENIIKKFQSIIEKKSTFKTKLISVNENDQKKRSSQKIVTTLLKVRNLKQDITKEGII